MPMHFSGYDNTTEFGRIKEVCHHIVFKLYKQESNSAAEVEVKFRPISP